MEPDLKTALDGHTACIAEVLAENKTQTDHLILIRRQLADIAIMVTPKEAGGPSPLELLLAQLAAQGREQLRLLHQIARDVAPETKTAAGGNSSKADGRAPNGAGNGTRRGNGRTNGNGGDHEQ